jgi:hypothetical protein
LTGKYFLASARVLNCLRERIQDSVFDEGRAFRRPVCRDPRLQAVAGQTTRDTGCMSKKCHGSGKRILKKNWEIYLLCLTLDSEIEVSFPNSVTEWYLSNLPHGLLKVLR